WDWNITEFRNQTLDRKALRRSINGSQDCKDGRPQEGNGHHQEHGLSQVRQANTHREAGERSRARGSRRDFYFLLGLRILRETLTPSAAAKVILTSGGTSVTSIYRQRL